MRNLIILLTVRSPFVRVMSLTLPTRLPVFIVTRSLVPWVKRCLVRSWLLRRRVLLVMMSRLIRVASVRVLLVVVTRLRMRYVSLRVVALKRRVLLIVAVLVIRWFRTLRLLVFRLRVVRPRSLLYCLSLRWVRKAVRAVRVRSCRPLVSFAAGAWFCALLLCLSVLPFVSVRPRLPVRILTLSCPRIRVLFASGVVRLLTWTVLRSILTVLPAVVIVRLALLLLLGLLMLVVRSW